MIEWFAFFASFSISALIIRLASPIAEKFGLMDIPGGHKQHAEPVPLVGGISIYLSVFLAWLIMSFLGITNINLIFMAGSGMLLAVGIFDDRFKLSVKLRLFMQIIAALFMVSSNVILYDLGALFSESHFLLGSFAIPMTIFATIGVINAMNMMDGIDGLAGMVSLTTLTLLLGVLYSSSGYQSQMILIACLIGAICGFLIFNFRWHGVDKAQVFLGDAGSTVLGFLFAWLFISVSQGEQRAMSPVTALWIFAIPLLDTVGNMIRRITQKNSPFTGDRFHIHHLLIDAGFKVSHAVLIIAFAQMLLGLLGLSALHAGLSEATMFIGFLALSAIYVYKISRPTVSIPMFRAIHGKAGLIRDNVRMVYVGDINLENAKQEIEAFLGDKLWDYHFEIYQGIRANGEQLAYAVIDVNHGKNVKKMMNQLYRHKSIDKNIEIHQFVPRNPANDERYLGMLTEDKRTNDRSLRQVQRVYCSKKRDMQSDPLHHASIR